MCASIGWAPYAPVCIRIRNQRYQAKFSFIPLFNDLDIYHGRTYFSVNTENLRASVIVEVEDYSMFRCKHTGFIVHQLCNSKRRWFRINLFLAKLFLRFNVSRSILLHENCRARPLITRLIKAFKRRQHWDHQIYSRIGKTEQSTILETIISTIELKNRNASNDFNAILHSRFNSLIRKQSHVNIYSLLMSLWDRITRINIYENAKWRTGKSRFDLTDWRSSFSVPLRVSVQTSSGKQTLPFSHGISSFTMANKVRKNRVATDFTRSLVRSLSFAAARKLRFSR